MVNNKAVKVGDESIITSSGISIGGGGISITAVSLSGVWWNLIMTPFWNDVMITYWNISMNEEI